MVKVLSYISPVLFGLPFRSNCPLFKITMIIMMEHYADGIMKILNKSYYIYSNEFHFHIL